MIWLAKRHAGKPDQNTERLNRLCTLFPSFTYPSERASVPHRGCRGVDRDCKKATGRADGLFVVPVGHDPTTP